MRRWAGSWGIEADFVAKTKCSLLCIDSKDLQARGGPWQRTRARARARRVGSLGRLVTRIREVSALIRAIEKCLYESE